MAGEIGVLLLEGGRAWRGVTGGSGCQQSLGHLASGTLGNAKIGSHAADFLQMPGKIRNPPNKINLISGKEKESQCTSSVYTYNFTACVKWSLC